MMASAMQCDRCGNYYNSYEKYRGLNGVALIHVPKAGKEYYLRKVYDLCPECLDAAKIFLSNAEKT